MCGRYARSRPDTELVEVFGVRDVIGEPPPASYNIAPTQGARVVLERGPRRHPDAAASRQLRTLRWGLVPAWANDAKIGNRMINARVETITEKPAFKRAAYSPADGYYEWEMRLGAANVPRFLHDAQRPRLGLCWTTSCGRTRPRLRTFRVASCGPSPP